MVGTFLRAVLPLHSQTGLDEQDSHFSATFVRPLLVRRQQPFHMSEATSLPTMRQSRFSSGWGVAVALLHFVGTFAMVGMRFVVGMGAFTTPSYSYQRWQSDTAFWEIVHWVWSPLALAAWTFFAPQNEGLFAVLATLWSCAMGICAGVAVASFRRWLDRPLYPPSTINHPPPAA